MNKTIRNRTSSESGKANSSTADVGSIFKRDLTRLMGQAEDALRSVRVLSDYLEQHPEALIQGKGLTE